MRPISIREILSGQHPLRELKVAGWIKTHRQSKRVSFIELGDGSCVAPLQLVVDPTNATYAAAASKLTTGASIIAEGTLVDSPAKGQKYEFQVASVQLVGEADPELYPLQKK